MEEIILPLNRQILSRMTAGEKLLSRRLEALLFGLVRRLSASEKNLSLAPNSWNVFKYYVNKINKCKLKIKK